jgi:sodium-dependent dicarboxylate transporter 2/3/5
MKRYVWLLIGIIVFAIMQIVGSPSGLPGDAWDVICVATLMTILWISESIELGITALLPIVLFPILGITPFEKVTLQYANETIFMFMGGFMLAIALERSRIHERFAMHCIRLIGGTPSRVILGFIVVIFLLSMWVSNTAAVLMTVPICTAVIDRLKAQARPDEEGEIKKFSKALYLSLAYAASIGGICTLIGTPPNIVLASILGQANVTLTFVHWMIFATPFAVIFMAIVWLYLTKVLMTKKARNMKINSANITAEISNLGPMTTHEKRVAVVFVCIVALWIFRGLINIEFFTKISDTTVAIAGALALFLIPCDKKSEEHLLEWKDAARLPWNILLLFGGGLALSQGFLSSGLSSTIATYVSGLHNLDMMFFIVIISLTTVVLTELMSNTATANLLIPISIGVAAGLGANPMMIAIPVAISSSFAFMLPISTPPNAIVYSFGYIRIREMALTGLALNIIGLILVSIYSYFLVPIVF